jgi:hypothetical protein
LDLDFESHLPGQCPHARVVFGIHSFHSFVYFDWHDDDLLNLFTFQTPIFQNINKNNIKATQ